jgi:hypothetical protein
MEGTSFPANPAFTKPEAKSRTNRIRYHVLAMAN